MNLTLKAGLLLGVLCALWQLIMGITGWFLDPVLLNLFWVVILIQIGVLVWALNKTATSNTYWQQVGKGTLISLTGGIILFIFSIIFTSVLFPDYFAELRAMQEKILQESGISAEEIRRQIQMTEMTQNTFTQALFGFLGTVITGFIISLIVAAVKRRKV